MLTSILLSEIVTGGWGAHHLFMNIRKKQREWKQNTRQQTILIRQLASVFRKYKLKTVNLGQHWWMAFSFSTLCVCVRACVACVCVIYKCKDNSKFLVGTKWGTVKYEK